MSEDLKECSFCGEEVATVDGDGECPDCAETKHVTSKESMMAYLGNFAANLKR